MKHLNIYFLILLFMISCTAKKNETAETKTTTETTQPKSNQSSSTLEKQKSCELFTTERIAKLLNVELSSLKTDDMGHSEKRSICYFYNAEGKRKLFIRLGWKSDKAIEKKTLETQYKNFINNGVEEVSYQEISSENGNQVIAGIQPDRENMYIHIVRKRFGNSAEATLELRHESDAANVKDELLKMIEEIN